MKQTAAVMATSAERASGIIPMRPQVIPGEICCFSECFSAGYSSEVSGAFRERILQVRLTGAPDCESVEDAHLRSLGEAPRWMELIGGKKIQRLT